MRGATATGVAEAGATDRLRCLVTGANAGIGRATTLRLARRGHPVVMGCRSRRRAREARAAIRAEVPSARLEVLELDLADLDSVRRAARAFRGRHPALDVLVANAGLYRADLRRTADGFEETMAVNHLGHFLLARLLLEPLRRARGRVLAVSSEAHRRGDLESRAPEAVLRGEGEFGGVQAYCDSKLANVLFVRELARRESDRGIAAAALHPGTLATRIWDRNRDLLSLASRLVKPFMGRAHDGGAAVERLALAPREQLGRGRYFDRDEPADPAPQARDAGLARRLWEASARAVGLDDGDPAVRGGGG